MNNELNTHMHNWTNPSQCEEGYFRELSEWPSSCGIRN